REKMSGESHRTYRTHGSYWSYVTEERLMAETGKLDIAGSRQGMQHFGLTVEDLDKSVEFYVEVLGGKLALSGDGFYGEEVYNTLFQKDYLDAARRGIDPRDLGVVDLRSATRAVLDVRIISFGNATVE